VSTLDLDNPPPNHHYRIAVEREETSGERQVRLIKDLALFAVALGFVVLIAWLCVQTVISPTASPDEKKWAMSVLSAATGGVIGYLIRR
jgi:hypothetical protein